MGSGPCSQISIYEINIFIRHILQGLEEHIRVFGVNAVGAKERG